MSLFQSLILFDVIAIAVIAATIYALSISHPADETRSETAAVVEAIVNRLRLRRSRRAGTLSFENRLKADLVARMIFTSRHGPASGTYAGAHADQVAKATPSAGRATRASSAPSDQTA